MTIEDRDIFETGQGRPCLPCTFDNEVDIVQEDSVFMGAVLNSEELLSHVF